MKHAILAVIAAVALTACAPEAAPVNETEGAGGSAKVDEGKVQEK